MSIVTGTSISDRLFDEAKKLLDLESGRPSLPTVQALALLFLGSAYLGRDRAGQMYRYAAFEMLKRLQLDKKFARLNPDDPLESQDQRLISKALWGLFCFERYIFPF
jgi:hypothetical protein